MVDGRDVFLELLSWEEKGRLMGKYGADVEMNIRIAGNLVPDVPTILKFRTFPPPSKVEKCQTDDPNFLVGARLPATDKTSCVFSSPNLAPL